MQRIDALHGWGVITRSGDALAGAKLGEGLILFATQGLKATEQSVWEGIKCDSHGFLFS
jgi:hypothetical protein